MYPALSLRQNGPPGEVCIIPKPDDVLHAFTVRSGRLLCSGSPLWTADLTEDTPHYRVVLLQMIRPRVRYNKKRKVKQPKRNVSRYTIMSSVCLSLLHTALIVTVELLSRGQSSSAAVRVCWCFVLCFVCVRLKSNVLPFYFYVDT